MEEGRQYVRPEIEKRQFRRARLVTQVECASLGREELLVTRDISIGGMFLTSQNPFPSDSEVELSFRLKPAGPLISCRGKVVYSVRDLGMGISFESLNEDACHAIQKFVDAAD